MNTNTIKDSLMKREVAVGDAPVDAFLDVVARLIARAHLRRLSSPSPQRKAPRPTRPRPTKDE